MQFDGEFYLDGTINEHSGKDNILAHAGHPLGEEDFINADLVKEGIMYRYKNKAGEDMYLYRPVKMGAEFIFNGYKLYSLKITNNTLLPRIELKKKPRPKQVIFENTDLPFVDDPRLVGRWEAVDFVRVPGDFSPETPSYYSGKRYDMDCDCPAFYYILPGIYCMFKENHDSY
jgi:hypothetical protein